MTERNVGDRSRARALSDAMRAFTDASTDYERVLRTVAERMVEFVADTCVVLLVDDARSKLLPVALHDRDPEIARLTRELLTRVRPFGLEGTHLSASVVRTNQAVFLPVVDPQQLAARAVPDYAAVVQRIGFRAVMCIPLRMPDESIGVLALLRHGASTEPFDEDDLAVAQGLADHAVLAFPMPS